MNDLRGEGGNVNEVFVKENGRRPCGLPGGELDAKMPLKGTSFRWFLLFVRFTAGRPILSPGQLICFGRVIIEVINFR